MRLMDLKITSADRSALPRQTPCFFAALYCLNREPKDLLDDKKINKLIDSYINKCLLNKFFPDYIFTHHTKRMHATLFNHLCCLMNPSDLTNIFRVNVITLTLVGNTVQATIEINFARGNDQYRYKFTVKYQENFNLRIVFRNMVVSPEKCIAWNYQALPEKFRRVCFAFAKCGMVPPDKFAEIEATFVVALNPKVAEHTALLKICGTSSVTRDQVDRFLADLKYALENEQHHLFQLRL